MKTETVTPTAESVFRQHWEQIDQQGIEALLQRLSDCLRWIRLEEDQDEREDWLDDAEDVVEQLIALFDGMEGAL